MVKSVRGGWRVCGGRALARQDTETETRQKEHSEHAGVCRSAVRTCRVREESLPEYRERLIPFQLPTDTESSGEVRERGECTFMVAEVTR